MGPNTKKFTVDGSQITVTNRIKLGNKGDASKKSILFSVGSGMQGELTLCAVSGSGSADSEIALFKKDDNTQVSGTLTTLISGQTPTTIWENIPEGEYYVATTANSGAGANIYYVRLKEQNVSTGAIQPPVPATITATQSDSADLSKVTVSGTGTAGGEGSYYVVKKVGPDGKETEKKIAGNAATFEMEDTLEASGKYTYTVYGLGKAADGNDAKDTTFAGSAEVNYVLPLGTTKVTAVPGNSMVKVSWTEVDER